MNLKLESYQQVAGDLTLVIHDENAARATCRAACSEHSVETQTGPFMANPLLDRDGYICW